MNSIYDGLPPLEPALFRGELPSKGVLSAEQPEPLCSRLRLELYVLL